jgi:hypothetical protein
MGRAKDWEMEQEARGWWSVAGKYVCAECFEEEFLKQFVRNHAEASECDYCGSTAEDLTGNDAAPIAAPFDSVMEIIAEGLHSEWNDADNESIPYESAEGGYQANTYSSYQLVWDYVQPGNDQIAEEIIHALPDHAWVERGYWSLSKGQALWYGWENFCDLVKHRNRYMFHLRPGARPREETMPPRNIAEVASSAGSEAPERASQQFVPVILGANASFEDAQVGNPADHGSLIVDFSDLLRPEPIDPRDMAEAIEDAQEGVSASSMLDEIGDAVNEVALIRELPARTKLFRGRVGPSRTPYRTARRLGPPPQGRTIANRMSPAGIPMFYGALDEYTAVAETVLGRLKNGRILNLGTFETRESFHVLDLTNIPPVPSLFSPLRDQRPTLGFLHSFADDLSKPIEKDDRVHTEYAPTQIVTEYFRYSFNREAGPSIRGILYPSSRSRGGIACVLFFTREECGATATERFMRKKQWLRFVPGSPKMFKQKPRRRLRL